MSIIIIIVSGILGAVCTYMLNNRMKLGGVMASAIVTIVASLILLTFPKFLNSQLMEDLPFVIMGATFVGMASEKIAGSYLVIILSGIVYSLVFICTGTFFEGFGGSLGTTAAIAFCSILGLQKLFLKNRT